MKKALTIAGFDPTGGAGIQADLKVFQALGIYGLSVVSSLTAQNTEGVRDIMPVPGRICEKAAFCASLRYCPGSNKNRYVVQRIQCESACIYYQEVFAEKYRC